MPAAPPAPATNLTADQMDRFLAQLRPQSDANVARLITNIHLTERVSAIRMARWQSAISGSRSREALMAVADASAFLASPAAETAKLPPPDAGARQQILARCRDYVNERLQKLPNYVALRTTTSFLFAPADALETSQITNDLFQKKQGQKPEFRALGPAKSSDSPEPQYFWLGSYAQDVTYRGGAEVAKEPAQTSGQSPSSPDAMTTSGEFGSVLGIILIDAQEDQIAWDHWEQGTGGPFAVFRYAVPSERSHFAVAYLNELPEYPAYHGEVAIDPETGAVWRITILSRTSGSGFVGESSIAVEFAPTRIGEVTCICPVHSVSTIRFFDTFEYANTAHEPVPRRVSINDVAFTNYHLFHSEAHILSGTAGADR
jgi:hypothetical protein